MYSVTFTLQRPNTSVSFSDTNAQSLLFLKNEEFEALRSTAPGFLGNEKTFSTDRLTLTSVTRWESKEARAAFLAANRDLVQQRKALRSAYYLDNGIIATSTRE